MGAMVSSVLGSGTAAQEQLNQSKKRAIEEEFDAIMTSPKKQKLNSTSAYIYKTLFKAGEDSDVTLVALGRNWPLHRVYLRQSPYFASMFTGNWKESHDSIVHMTIMDDNITAEALEITLGSLYCDELSISGQQVVGVLAAAVLLQLDPLIQYCTSIMRETICCRTLLHYYHVANRYGVVEVEGLCIQWLERCLLTEMTATAASLRSLPASMLQRTLASPGLFAVQTEFSVYVLLKMWLFVQLQPSFEGDHDDMLAESHKYFKNREEAGCFLDTAEGLKYRSVFWQVRLVYIVYHYLDMEMIANDRILPLSWIQPSITRQWYNMLRITQNKDPGPADVPEAVFERECSRCGRSVASASQHIWRWTGYNFGLDLVMLFDGHTLRIKRNMPPGDTSLMTAQRKIMYRVTVVSLNSQRQETFSMTSGIQSVALSKNEECHVMSLMGKDVQYPLLLSANFLVFTPSETTPLVAKEQLLSSSPSLPPLPPPPPRRPSYRRGESSSSSSSDDGSRKGPPPGDSNTSRMAASTRSNLSLRGGSSDVGAGSSEGRPSAGNSRGESSSGVGGARQASGDSGGSARPGVGIVHYSDVAGPSAQHNGTERRRILYLGMNRRRSRNVEDVGEELRDFERRNRANEAREGGNERSGGGSAVEPAEDNGPAFPEIVNYRENDQGDYDALMNYLARVDEEDFFDADEEENEDNDWAPANEEGGEQRDLQANGDEEGEEENGDEEAEEENGDEEAENGDDSDGEDEEGDQSGSDNAGDDHNSDAESIPN